MPHGYCRPLIFLPPDSITLLLPITANGTLSWNINKKLSTILCVTSTIFTKIWYLFLYICLFLPYPFALEMFKYTPWQCNWSIFIFSFDNVWLFQWRFNIRWLPSSFLMGSWVAYLASLNLLLHLMNFNNNFLFVSKHIWWVFNV